MRYSLPVSIAPLPTVDALDPRELRTGGKLRFDDRPRERPGLLAAGDGRDDGNGCHGDIFGLGGYAR